MKILLACTSIQDEHRSEGVQDNHYPLGLAYLQTYIEKHRPDKDKFVNLYLNNVPYEECYSTLKEALKNFKPQVLGISLMTHSRVSAYKMIEYTHKRYPKIKIIVGGMHPTVMWEQMAEKYPYITIVRGEGEVTFCNFLNALENEEPLTEILGLAYHDGEKVCTTGTAPLIEDLDDLPFPKHELFLGPENGMANLLTSRGCPYRCNFCVLDWMSKRVVRFRSGENIADEVEMLLAKFPKVRTIWIHDDAFMINKDRTIEFCDAIINRGIKTQFIASARFRPISHEVVFKMKQAGFVQVLFGLESGADAVIKGMRKGIKKEHVRYGLELFAKAGMKATAFLIAGLPGETSDTIDETIDFVQQLQNIEYLYYDDIGVSMVYPGTEMYTMAKETGKIDDDYWLTDKDVPYYTQEVGGPHTYETLLEFKDRIRKSIALEFLFKKETFINQRKLIPKILEYSQKFGMQEINNLLNRAIDYNKLQPQLAHAAFMGTSPALLELLARAFENLLVGSIISPQITSESETQEYQVSYDTQIKKDIEWRKKCEEQQEVIRERLSKIEDAGDVAYVKKGNDTVVENVSKNVNFNISTMGGV